MSAYHLTTIYEVIGSQALKHLHASNTDNQPYSSSDGWWWRTSLLRVVGSCGERDEISQSKRRHYLEDTGEELAEPPNPELLFECFVHGPQQWVFISTRNPLIEGSTEFI